MTASLPLIDQKLDSDAVFPDSVRAIQLESAHKLLVYILRRPDIAFKAPTLERVMRMHRNVRTEYLQEFYMVLSGLIRSIHTYINFEESCSMSGKYRRDLDLARERLERIVRQFEDEPEQRNLKYLLNLTAGS